MDSYYANSVPLCISIPVMHVHTHTNILYVHTDGFWQTGIELAQCAHMAIHFAPSSVFVANGQSLNSLERYTQKAWPPPHPA